MLKVLVLEQEPDTESFLKSSFEKEEYKVCSAKNINDARGLLKCDAYDLILADMMMHGLADSEAFLEELNALCAKTQIIFTGIPDLGFPVKPLKEKICKRVSDPAVMHCFLSETNRIMFLNTLLDFRSYMMRCGSAFFSGAAYSADVWEIALQIALLEVHDSYSATHQRRVGNLAADIAVVLGMDFSKVGLVRFAGYIHDIGKIKVPRYYLDKRGLLTEKEREAVQRHPWLGREMVRNCKICPHIAEIVGQHHERIDGSGYPNGLLKKDIHDESLIIMVADVADAMLSDRPYRPAYKIRTVMLELKKYAGILYDADVVDACCRLFDKKTYIYKNIYI